MVPSPRRNIQRPTQFPLRFGYFSRSIQQARIKTTVGTKETSQAATPDGGDTVSSLESPIPTLEQQAEHGVDSLRRESPSQDIPEDLAEDAFSGEIEPALPAEFPNESRYRDVLRAEHVEGFGTQTNQQDGEVPSEPLDTVVSPTENASEADPEHQLHMELPEEPRYREVLNAEHVEGFGSPSAHRGGGETPQTNREGVAPPAEKMPNAGSKNGVIKLPNDPRYREVLTAEHVEGFGAPQNQQDGGAAHETENYPDTESEDELAIELPDDVMNREVLTTKPLEGHGAPLGQEDGGTESGADEGAGLDTFELPNDDRRSDVPTSYHVETDGDPLLVREDSQRVA